MTGEWPHNQIDHINLDKADNRWNNLRAATRTQNGANKPRMLTNRSGLKGVDWCRFRGGGGKWRAQIKANRKVRYLGLFDTAHQAALAYAITAEKQFGDFARPTLEDVCLDIFMKEWRDNARWKFDWASIGA